MKAALIGSVSSSEAVLRGLLRGGVPIAGVCGLAREFAAGVSDFRDLQPFAVDAGIPFLGFRKVVEPAVEAFLAECSPDWLFVVGLSQLVPDSIRRLARRGAIGFHPTLLPEGRGRAPVAWTILLQKQAAANLFFLAEEADAGDIIAQVPVPVLAHDYAADLIERANRVPEDTVAELCPAFIAGEVPRTPQDHNRASYYPRRRPEDGRIDWCQSAEAVYRLIRAVSRPYPGAFTHRGGNKLIIWRAQPIVEEIEKAPAGTVIDVRKNLPVVHAGSECLLLTDIESEGGDGQPWQVGERLV